MDRFKHFLIESTDQALEHEILNMYKDRYRYKVSDISKLTGISTAGVYRVLEKYGINPHRNQPKGDYGLVNQYANTGTPIHKISELTGYSKRQIYNILKH